MSDEWVSAAEAYGLIEAATDQHKAGRSICSRARDGLITARARRLIMGSKAADDAEVPTSFWWAKGEAALEQNWATGDFETWIDQRIHCRAYGVEFRRSDIEAMLPRRVGGMPSRASVGNYAPPGNASVSCANRWAAVSRRRHSSSYAVVAPGWCQAAVLPFGGA